MRRLIPLVLLSLLALVPIGISSPIEGTESRKLEVGATPSTTTRKFQAGERACVLAFQSESKTPVNLHVTIYDVKSGNVVVEDKSTNKLVGDFIGVVWYPPRTGEYKIELRQSSSEKVACYMAIK